MADTVVPFDQFFAAPAADPPSTYNRPIPGVTLAPPTPATADQHTGEANEIQREMARPDTTPRNKAVLQDELGKTQKLANGAKPAATIPFDDFFAGDPHTVVAKGLLEQTWDGVKKSPGNIAALGDMLLSLPGQAVGVGADMGMRAYATALGIDHRTGGIMAEKFRNEVAGKTNKFLGLDNPLQKLMKATGFNDETYSNSEVSSALGTLMGWVGEGSGKVEKATNGALTKEDVGSLVNELITLGGARGLSATLGAKLESMAKPKIGGLPEGGNTAADVIKARGVQDPNAPPDPGQMANQHAADLRAQDAINRTTGVDATEASKATQATQRADARAAFKDDATYTEYLRQTAEMRAQEASDASIAAMAAKPRIKLKTKAAPAVVPPLDEPPVTEDAKAIAAAQQPLDLSPEALTLNANIEGEVGAKPGVRAPVVKPEPAQFGEEVPKFQRGGADVKTLTTIAAAGLGIYAGMQLDDKNPFAGGLLGLLGGVTLSGSGGKIFDNMRRGAAADPRIRINDLINARETQQFRAERDAMQFSASVAKAVPKGIDRVRITAALDRGYSATLPPALAKAAARIKAYYANADAGDPKVSAQAAAIYNNHVWNPFRTKDANIKALLGNTNRRISIQEGKAAGLVPLTEDAAVLAHTYGKAYARVVANWTFVEHLKMAKIPGSLIPLATSAAKAPPGYYTINSPAAGGMMFHPDIINSVKFLLEAQDPTALWAGLSAVNTTLKRLAVAVSLFHAKSLFDAGLAASKNPGVAIKVLGQAVAPKIFGENAYLTMLRQGGAGDLVDFAGSSGLKFSMDRWMPGTQDLQSSSFYGGMKSLQTALDNTIPGLGNVVRPLAAVNHAFDHFTWNRLHTAFKLEVFASKAETLMENSAKAGKPLSHEDAGAIAADFANFAFGGINWGRFAEGFTTKIGRDAALRMFSPQGRRALNQGIFALDWTIATNGNLVRAVTRDLGEGAVKGLFSAKNLGDLHRQNIVRGLIYYGVVGDAVNYAMSGHHLWENKDWTRIELGDGRSMQLSKHLLEPFEFFQNPRQTLMNKTAQMPREVIEQMANQEYLSAHGAPPIVPARTKPIREAQLRAEHAINSIVPIAGEQFARGGLATGTAGMLGVPIYGQTAAEKRQDRLNKALENYKKLSGNP